MEVSVLVFGQLQEKVGADSLRVAHAADTRSLLAELLRRYPGLTNEVFAIAVNRRTVDGVVELEDGDEVALMPPFSGG